MMFAPCSVSRTTRRASASSSATITRSRGAFEFASAISDAPEPRALIIAYPNYQRSKALWEVWTKGPLPGEPPPWGTPDLPYGAPRTSPGGAARDSPVGVGFPVRRSRKSPSRGLVQKPDSPHDVRRGDAARDPHVR